MTAHLPHPGARFEWLVVLALSLVAAALRFVSFGRLGLTHFDEGVYALAGLWSVTPGGINPELIAYAPPGYPVLVGLAYVALGVSDGSALIVSVLCGVLTVPAAAWVGRRTFGPGAGAAAAAFAALAVAHVAFSRKALTDAPFLLAWLIAVGLGGRFLERPGFARAVAFGLAVGLAQWFKYNGWIAGAVVLIAAVCGLGADREARGRSAIARTFGWGLFAAGIALAVYLPWYRFVEAHGGYASLVRHHQSYLQGPSAWPRNLSQQLAQVVALSGGRLWGATTWAVAWSAAALGACGTRMVVGRSRWDWARFRIGLLLGAAFLAAIPDLGWWGGLAWFAWLVFDPRPTVRVLAAWWLSLSVLTPLYHPYARLWLPLHAAGWLLMGGAVVALGPFSDTAQPAHPRDLVRRPKLLAQGAAVLVCLVLVRARWEGADPNPFPLRDVFGPTDGLRLTVSDVVNTSPLTGAPGVVLRVLARRPVAYYLALQGKVRFRLVAGTDAVTAGPDGPNDWCLVDDVLTHPVGWKSEGGNDHGLIYRRIAAWPSWLDPVTRLDVAPGSVFEEPQDSTPYQILLLRPAHFTGRFPAPGLPPRPFPPSGPTEGPP